MDQISQHKNTTNKKMYYYDRMSKMIVNLGIKKGNRNTDSSAKSTDNIIIYSWALLTILKRMHIMVNVNHLKVKCVHLL